MSVLMTSDLAQGLFHRAISQSGVMGTMGKWQTSSDVAAQLERVAKSHLAGQ